MRNLLLLSLLALSGAVHAALPIDAADGAKAQELAKASGCLSCHSLTEKIVGPAYSKVAEKYEHESDAVDTLMHSVQYGSKGKWGRIPMPPHMDMPVLSIEKPQ
jgi:cytochrome c